MARKQSPMRWMATLPTRDALQERIREAAYAGDMSMVRFITCAVEAALAQAGYGRPPRHVVAPLPAKPAGAGTRRAHAKVG